MAFWFVLGHFSLSLSECFRFLSRLYSVLNSFTFYIVHYSIVLADSIELCGEILTIVSLFFFLSFFVFLFCFVYIGAFLFVLSVWFLVDVFFFSFDVYPPPFFFTFPSNFSCFPSICLHPSHSLFSRALCLSLYERAVWLQSQSFLLLFRVFFLNSLLLIM